MNYYKLINLSLFMENWNYNKLICTKRQSLFKIEYSVIDVCVHIKYYTNQSSFFLIALIKSKSNKGERAKLMKTCMIGMEGSKWKPKFTKFSWKCVFFSCFNIIKIIRRC